MSRLMSRLARRAAFAACCLCFVLSAELTLAGEAVVGQNVPASSRVSVDRISHADFDALLKKYVNDRGQVAYTKWHSSRSDVSRLNQYLAELSRADLDAAASREGKLAFWINAYNAVTIRGILDEWPTTSIRNHTAKLWGFNIWDDVLLKVDGKQFSLNQMEHEVLRKMGDPRIHFAIVCASIGCPRLLNAAYVPAELDQQLDLNARNFFAQPQNFKLRGRSVQLSSILDWFGSDFGSGNDAVLRRIAEWAPKNAQSALRRGGLSISYADYDWGINAQR